MRTFPTSSTEIKTEHHDAISPLGSVHQSPATASSSAFFNDKSHTPSPFWNRKRRSNGKKGLRSSSSSNDPLNKVNDNNADGSNVVNVEYEEEDEEEWTETGYVLPTEPQMVLLCLDYLRTLVRSHNIRELEEQHCLNHKAISAAVDELSKAFMPTQIKSDFNLLKELEEEGGEGGVPKENSKHRINRVNDNDDEEKKDDDMNQGFKNDVSLPAINLHEATDPFDLMDNDECGSANGDDDTASVLSNGTNGGGGHSILHRKRNAAARKAKKNQLNQKPKYAFIDSHPSNAERFFSLSGLSSSPPLSLGEVVASGLVGLNARTRRAAERDLCQNQMFQQFLDAVTSRGFFEGVDSPTSTEEKDLDSSFARTQAKRRQAQYETKFYKVVEKFRLKLAKQAAAEEEERGRTLLTPSSGILTVATNALLDGSGMNSGTVVVSTTNEEGLHHDGSSVHTHQTNKSSKTTRTSVSVRSCSGAKGLVPTDATRVLATNMAELHRQQHKDIHEQFYANNVVGQKCDDEDDEEGRPTSLKIVEYHPDDVEHAEAFKQKGNKCMQKKQFEEAIDYYSKALRICPSSDQSHVYYSNRSAALLSLKYFEDAVEDGERALALDPSYGKAHGRLGWAYYCLGRYGDAIDAYELAMRYDPDHAASHKKQWKAAKNKYDDQQQRIRREEQEITGTSKSQENTTAASTSSSSVFDEEDNKAKQELIRQKEAEALKAKGNSYMSQREYNKAIDAYTQAIQLCPNGPSSHLYFSNRSAALCYVQKYEQAELDAEESLSLDPEYPKAYARLGLARFFLQDYEGSIDAYQTALDLEPDNAAAKSYLAKAKKRLSEEENKAG